MRAVALDSVIGVITFLLAWNALMVYLLMLRNNYMFFYVICLLISILILTHVIRSNLEKIIYLEILLTFLALQFIPIAYAGLNNIFGLDTYLELAPIRRIIATGHWVPISTIRGLETTYYPMHLILVAVLSLITDCNPIDVARFIPLYFNFIVLTYYFLIMKKIVNCDYKDILLCLLCFSFTFPYTRAAFSHQFAALPYLFTICYIFLKLLLNYTKNQIKYNIILFIFIICLIYTHHLTRVLLLVYILTFYVTYLLFKLGGKIKMLTVLGISSSMLPNLNIRVVFSTVLMLVLLFISYFIYTYEFGVFVSIKAAVLTIIGIHSPTIPNYIPSKSVLSTQMVVYYYGSTIILLISVFVVLLSRIYSNRFLIVSFIMYAVISFVLHVVLRFALNVHVEPFRASLFGSPFMLVALFYSLSLKLKQNNQKFNFLAVVIILLTIFYIIVNLLPISGFYIDKNYSPNWNKNEFVRYIPIEVRTAVLYGIKHDILNEVFGDIYIYRSYLYYTFKPIIEDYKPFMYLISNINEYKYSYFYLTDMDKHRIFTINCKLYPFPKVTKDMYIAYQLSDRLEKIYDNPKVKIYSVL